MKIYLVGGAVRDMLLGLPIKDRDWVVVGATPNQMLDAGYQQVGADFPVFIHPDTKEEYALARTEKKVGSGYKGFKTECNSRTSLEEDLRRRDLTINAIAYDPKTKQYIDPYGGIQDLCNGILRHVSEAFADDPVRVLRAARFRARFGTKYKIHKATMYFMSQLVEEGELDYLTVERVWLEFQKAIMEKEPELFFHALQQCGAFGKLFPEFTSTFTLALPNTYYLRLAVRQGLTADERITVFLFDRPKAVDMLERLKAPQQVTQLIRTFQTLYNTLLTQELTASSAITLFENMDAYRRPSIFLTSIRISELFDSISMKAKILNSVFQPVLNIGFDHLTVAQKSSLQGSEVGSAIRQRRIFEATKVLRW